MIWFAVAAIMLIVLFLIEIYVSIGREGRLMDELDALREDNKALTEALVRANGRGLVFSKPVVEPSEGWFDAKPRVVLPDKSK